MQFFFFLINIFSILNNFFQKIFLGIKNKCKEESCEQYCHINCAYFEGYKLKIDTNEIFDEKTLTLSEFKIEVWCKTHAGERDYK